MVDLRAWEDGMATLYLTEQRSLVKKDAETLVVHIPADEKAGVEKRQVRVPLIKVSQVVAYGDVTLTSGALGALMERGVDVCFCSYHGQFRGRLTPPLGKNSLVRLEQHRAHNDPERTLALAKAFVGGKLGNMRAMLLRANRKRDDEEIASAADSLRRLIAQVESLRLADGVPVPDPSRPQAGTAMGTLQGLEGSGTALYFGAFSRLLKEEWGFQRRLRRPPRDPVNAMLSFGYVLLTNQVASAVSIVGLDPYVGFLHSSQFGKPALALDVMEPFRPVIVDSIVLTLLNTGMLSRHDFREELGAWHLSEGARRTFLRKFEERLDTEIEHPVFGYKATYRRSLELEVRLVAKWLVGEVVQYRPFVVR
ncbi:MAG: type I-D CRISPR-associated endonuclease Cas1d [Anaerolineae bacterium]|nr:type I-D CRISPR-associated endonuclease Cas1d [Anaerolineae bacterium]